LRRQQPRDVVTNGHDLSLSKSRNLKWKKRLEPVLQQSLDTEMSELITPQGLQLDVGKQPNLGTVQSFKLRSGESCHLRRHKSIDLNQTKGAELKV
jgi:hypothetical protein